MAVGENVTEIEQVVPGASIETQPFVAVYGAFVPTPEISIDEEVLFVTPIFIGALGVLIAWSGKLYTLGETSTVAPPAPVA